MEVLGWKKEGNVSIEKEKNVNVDYEEENESKATIQSEKKQTTIFNNIDRELKCREDNKEKKSKKNKSKDKTSDSPPCRI